MSTYSCAICKAQVRYRGPLPVLYPFCSERCRMVDLGLWFRQAYTIERGMSPPEVGAEDSALPESPPDEDRRPP